MNTVDIRHSQVEGGVPVLGVLPEWWRSPLTLVERYAREYGDIVSLPVGPLPMVLVSSPALIENRFKESPFIDNILVVGEKLTSFAFGGVLLIFAGLMIFLQANNFFAFAFSSVVFGVGGGLLGPAYQSLISKVVPAKMLGTFSGVFESSRGFISLPAPWLGAQLWENVSPQTPFLITSLATLVILPQIWFKFKAPKDQSPTASPAWAWSAQGFYAPPGSASRTHSTPCWTSPPSINAVFAICCIASGHSHLPRRISIVIARRDGRFTSG